MNARTGIRDLLIPPTVDESCRWRAAGDFALVHPSGWSIARYSVYGEWRYLLWEPIERCANRVAPTSGNLSHGPFDDVRDAMRLHRELTQHHLPQEKAA